MMGWYGHGGFGTSWMLMGIFWVLLAVAVSVLVVWLLARLRAERVDPAVAARSALEQLDRQFAQGDINAATYHAKRAWVLSDPTVTR